MWRRVCGRGKVQGSGRGRFREGVMERSGGHDDTKAVFVALHCFLRCFLFALMFFFALQLVAEVCGGGCVEGERFRVQGGGGSGRG